MATNFQMTVKQERRNLHVKLRGDFDGISAFELIHLLRDKAQNGGHVLIDTGGLKKIYPFGKAVFRNNFSSPGSSSAAHFVITGKYAADIAPHGIVVES